MILLVVCVQIVIYQTPIQFLPGSAIGNFHLGIHLFINARTDLFLGVAPSTHEVLVAEAIDREVAYAEAGADGFFIPGLTDLSLIIRIVDAVKRSAFTFKVGLDCLFE